MKKQNRTIWGAAFLKCKTDFSRCLMGGKTFPVFKAAWGLRIWKTLTIQLCAPLFVAWGAPISWLIDRLIGRINWQSFKSFFKQKSQTFYGSSFLEYENVLLFFVFSDSEWRIWGKLSNLVTLWSFFSHVLTLYSPNNHILTSTFT